MSEVTLIPGDGIGPEVVGAARRVLDNVTSSIAWDEVPAGESAYLEYGTAVPPALFESLNRTRVALKGPIGVPRDGYPSPNAAIRREMGLWCNLRVAVRLDQKASPYDGTSIVLIRDVLEDLGRGAQQFVGPDAGITIKFITRSSVGRLARFAYGYATERGLDHVTIPHQATSNRTTDGLFLSEAMSIAAEFPSLTVDDEAMDALAMHLILHPKAYQVLMTSAFYGGILGGICAGLIGGVGMMPGVNLDGQGTLVFEAGHGSAPKYRGLNKANPTGMILSGAMLLEHLGLADESTRIHAALRRVLLDPNTCTYDQGGSASTSEMADAVIGALVAA